MQKNFRNITNFSQKPQADRIKQIQHKLQMMKQTKTNQVKEEKATNAVIRVTNIEKLSAELIRKLQTQLREQKQNLRELNREFEENTSKQELSLKNRVSEVNELQNRAATLLKTELQRTKQYQKKAIMHYQQKVETMRLMILQEIETRKQYFLTLDLTLSDKLPELQAEVAQRMQQSQENLTNIQNAIQSETQNICKQIQESQAKQLESFEELMKMMSSVIAQVKEEINSQKKTRESNKKRLVTLFEGAYGKLSC